MKATTLLFFLTLLTGSDLVDGVAVHWANGYTPTAEVHAAAVARAEAKAVEYNTTTDFVDRDLVARAGTWPTGCVQAHCLYQNSIIPAQKQIEYSVFHNGEYIFNLVAASTEDPGITTVYEWAGIKDHTNQQVGRLSTNSKARCPWRTLQHNLP